MRPARLLVLGCASPTPHGQDQMRRLTEQASRRGITVVGTDTRANLEASQGPLGIERLELEVGDAHSCRNWARTAPPVDAVLTFREKCVASVAAVSDELGLAGNAPEAVRVIRNKDLCREALRKAGLPQPRVRLVERPEEASAFINGTGPGPWVVKPRDGMGSEGVSLVRSADDLPGALARLTEQRPFLVEEFVEGPEFSAEGVMLEGHPWVLAITEKKVGSSFVEIGHRMPARVKEEETARAEVGRALEAVGITHGVFHVEFWLSRGRCVLGEIHARPGGDFIHAMVEHVRPGAELYGMLMDDLLGRATVSPTLTPTRAAGTDYLVLPPGRVGAVSGWDEAASMPSVLAAQLSVDVGQEIVAVDSSASRHGLVVVGADDHDQVESLLSKVAEKVRVDIEPV